MTITQTPLSHTPLQVQDAGRQHELEHLRAENARLRRQLDLLRAANDELIREKRHLRAAHDAYVSRAQAGSLFGPLEMTAGTLVGPQRQGVLSKRA